MSDAKLRAEFVKQRAELAAGVQRVRRRQAEAANQQESWPQFAEKLRHTILPRLAQHAQTLNTTKADVSLRPLQRSERRLRRFRQGLWRNPRLTALRLRNMRLWFVAYRWEIATAISLAIAILLGSAFLYFLSANWESIVGLLQSLVR